MVYRSGEEGCSGGGGEEEEKKEEKKNGVVVVINRPSNGSKLNLNPKERQKANTAFSTKPNYPSPHSCQFLTSGVSCV